MTNDVDEVETAPSNNMREVGFPRCPRIEEKVENHLAPLFNYPTLYSGDARNFSPITHAILSTLVIRETSSPLPPSLYLSPSPSFSVSATITISVLVYFYRRYGILQPRRWSVRVYCACSARKWIGGRKKERRDTTEVSKKGATVK